MILVLVESQNEQIKKSSLESLSLAYQISTLNGQRICALVLGSKDINIDLGIYGADETIVIPSENIEWDQIAKLIETIAIEKSAKQIILSLNSTGKNIAGVVAVKTKSSLISGVTQVSIVGDSMIYTKNVFSGKAYASYRINSGSVVIANMPNAVNINTAIGKSSTKEIKAIVLPITRIKSIDKKLVKGKTPLTEATIVVSAGRGMKDPSNWTMIEELAELLDATTACSRPVADVGWRPHHEHVGQTGIAIRPNVYIAIGISGAIQHLAGVNNSRKIIVINKDPEAPFFKAADYGICGDLFEIVPQLNAAIKKIKTNA